HTPRKRSVDRLGRRQLRRHVESKKKRKTKTHHGSHPVREFHPTTPRRFEDTSSLKGFNIRMFQESSNSSCCRLTREHLRMRRPMPMQQVSRQSPRLEWLSPGFFARAFLRFWGSPRRGNTEILPHNRQSSTSRRPIPTLEFSLVRWRSCPDRR